MPENRLSPEIIINPRGVVKNVETGEVKLPSISLEDFQKNIKNLFIGTLSSPRHIVESESLSQQETSVGHTNKKFSRTARLQQAKYRSEFEKRVFENKNKHPLEGQEIYLKAVKFEDIAESYDDGFEMASWILADSQFRVAQKGFDRIKKEIENQLLVATTSENKKASLKESTFLLNQCWSDLERKAYGDDAQSIGIVIAKIQILELMLGTETLKKLKSEGYIEQLMNVREEINYLLLGLLNEMSEKVEGMSSDTHSWFYRDGKGEVYTPYPMTDEVTVGKIEEAQSVLERVEDLRHLQSEINGY